MLMKTVIPQAVTTLVPRREKKFAFWEDQRWQGSIRLVPLQIPDFSHNFSLPPHLGPPPRLGGLERENAARTCSGGDDLANVVSDAKVRFMSLFGSLSVYSRWYMD